MSKTLVCIAMGEVSEHMNYSPTKEKSYQYISRIMNPSDDACKTGKASENKKSHRDTRSIKEDMECPPRCSPEHGMSRRKRIIREMIDERRETRKELWSWSVGKHGIEYPIERKGTKYMPKKIESHVFWSVMFLEHTISPECYEKYAKEYGF